MAGLGPDPWLTDRLRADVALVAAEKRVEAAVLAAIAAWLDTARALVLGLDSSPDIIAPKIKVGAQTGRSALVAAAGDELDLDAAQASFATWREALQLHIEPAVSEAFGAGFGGAARSAQISARPYQERHIRDVHDRLKIWPETAWEDMRPELQHVVSTGASIEDASNQVAGILDINAPTRKLREQIAEVDARLEDPDTDPADIRGLRARRRQLWNQHDQSLGRWQWLARRIARTETHGAIEGGQLAAAQATAQATGQAMFKRWLSTSDNRCRRTHRIADGQIVPIGERFRVGRALLTHPGQPGGPAHEVIQCRCTSLILSGPEVEDALASEWGRRGVQPMSLRMGPDDESAMDMALELLAREEAGEVVTWPDKEPAPVPGKTRRPRAYEEFKGASLDDLGQLAADAIEAQDFDRLDRVMAEEQRRLAANAAAQARRATAREAKEAAQLARYEQLLADGADDETAIEQAFGLSVPQQRRMNAIAHLRGLGYQGNGLDALIKAWHRDVAYEQWLAAENATNGQLLAPKYREALSVDPRALWSMNETQALKYASDELKQWWDQHGRATVAELKAQLLDPAELARIQSGRRDYLQ